MCSLYGLVVIERLDVDTEIDSRMEQIGKTLTGCHCCGLVQTVSEVDDAHRAVCCRCGAGLVVGWSRLKGNQRTAAFALAALLVYPFAIGLPILHVERLGFRHASGIVDGGMALIAHGEWVVALVVLGCSVVLPLFKLGGLFVLCTRTRNWLNRRHWSGVYRFVEWTGRWGMIDVLLVAILVAVVKVGDLVEIRPGTGLVAFTTFVVLNLIASGLFDPHAIWEES